MPEDADELPVLDGQGQVVDGDVEEKGLPGM